MYSFIHYSYLFTPIHTLFRSGLKYSFDLLIKKISNYARINLYNIFKNIIVNDRNEFSLLNF